LEFWSLKRRLSARCGDDEEENGLNHINIYKIIDRMFF